jgi:hypothetical protein
MCHRRAVRTRAVLLALILVAVGCGGDDPGPRPSTTTSTTTAGPGTAARKVGGPQACDLRTPADLQSALHRPFGAGGPAASPAYGTGCTWGTTAGDPPIYVSAAVATDEQLQVALGRVARELYEQTRKGVEVDENLPLGDSAYRAGPQVVVLAHGVLLSLAVTDTSAPSIAAIRTLAAAAVDALPR